MILFRVCRELLPIGDRPTLTELVQAASLTSQRLEMFTTSNPLSCLEDTCVEVYIRNIRSPDDKEAARLVLSTFFKAHLSERLFLSIARWLVLYQHGKSNCPPSWLVSGRLPFWSSNLVKRMMYKMPLCSSI